MTAPLVVAAGKRRVGTIEQLRSGKLQFTYDDDWRTATDANVMSLSMPRAVAVHRDNVVKPYLWGLLPDNDAILANWGRRFGVSPNNPFALIAHLGEDVAGAMQFLSEERFTELRAGGRGTAAVQWLTERDVADRLRLLHEDRAAWRLGTDTGQFSLPGAQPKTALLFDGKRWGVPSGRIPTTHIVKPTHEEFEGFPENEHLSLDLAGRLGIPTAASTVLRFEDQVAISIERFDRVTTGAVWERIHQEDMCQALGVAPHIKYESQGGPGAVVVADLLRSYSSSAPEDCWTFVRALVFNWLIAGTDAHAKNYAVLIDQGDRVRLAPLYDMASALPYRSIPTQKAKLAMRIGREYLVRRIGRTHWEELARDVRMDPNAVVAEARRMAADMPDAIADAVKSAHKAGLQDPIVTRLEDAVHERAAKCAETLTRRR